MKNKLLFTVVALLGLITATMAQVPNYVPTDGLVGYWPFNGNANDESGNGNNGTVNGATLTTDRLGITNASYDFNGTNQRIVVPDNNSLSFTNATFTLAYWVNIETPITNGAPTICKYGITNSFEYGNFVYSDNSVSFSTYNLGGTCGVNGSALSNSIPYQNNWHHFVSVHNGNNGASLYIDGVLISNSTTSNTNCSMGNGTGSLYFGFGGGWNQQFYFNGKLDDIGIWNRALTPQEITNLYNASLPPAACLPDYVPTDGLVGYWPFCGNANDESGNGNNGTVNGATLTTDRFGAENSAYSFGGNQEGIIINQNIFGVGTANISYTISLWILSDLVTNASGEIINNRIDNSVSSYNYRFTVLSDPTAPSYRFVSFINPNNPAQANSLPNILQNQVWDHLVLVGDIPQNQMRIYRNGILIASSNSIVSPNLTNATKIGYMSNLDPSFKGKIDDIAIYNRVLTPQEIQQLYTGSTVNPDEFTLYMDTIPGINGQQVLMPIRVKNFNNMLSAQFTLQFNPSVISYAGFLNPSIPSITGGSFGQAQINNGVLTFAWSQPNVTPVSLVDDALLVNLRFNVIGAGGSFSPITFINSPTPIEFVDQSFVPLSAYQTLPGRVDVLNIASLSGNLKTETGQPVRSATVAATGFATESAQSNLAGQYSLLLPQGQSYSISPSKGNDTLVTNGITTLDVLLIQRHILNILPLNSPYKIIAADVNQSGTVTSADLNLINALILANINAYPSGQFWAFVPDNHVFSNPQNPFPFPAARTYNNLNTAVNQDFFGMKLGDVNNSYNPALARLSRSENAVELYIENQNVTEEATIQVPVKVKNFSDIAGFQFAVQWDAQVLRYIEINPANGGLDVNKGETMSEAGKLNINWIDPNASAISLDDESVLFNITFEVVGALGSNTDVEIYSSMTTPVEIITAELEVAEHSLQEGKIAVSTPSSVLEIEAAGLSITAFPNPFKDLTTLSVESSVQRMAILEVYDISGRLISSERITLQQGNTQHQLNVSKASGNYMIVLSDASKGNRLATLKLVKE